MLQSLQVFEVNFSFVFDGFIKRGGVAGYLFKLIGQVLYAAVIKPVGYFGHRHFLNVAE